MSVGTHATHCCITHGCKYGDPDCPVVTGAVEMAYDGCQFGSEMDEPCDPQHDDKVAQQKAVEQIPTTEWATPGVLIAMRAAYVNGYLQAAKDIRKV